MLRWLLVFCLLALVGCSADNSEQIKAVEDRIVRLESQNAALEAENTLLALRVDGLGQRVGKIESTTDESRPHLDSEISLDSLIKKGMDRDVVYAALHADYVDLYKGSAHHRWNTVTSPLFPDQLIDLSFFSHIEGGSVIEGSSV